MSIEVAKETVSRPSDTLVSIGDRPSKDERMWLLNLCAQIIVDHKRHRFDQCLLFAMLIRLGLRSLGIKAWVHIGRATYFSEETGKKLFAWDHAWVQTERDLIDGNIDSLTQNPKIQTVLEIKPYWGPIESLPKTLGYKDYGVLEEYKDLLEDMNNEIDLYIPLLKKGLYIH